ncbi:MAG: hypothetical protein DI627_05785 [Acinetobacter sp.]|uniref:hypothetical protein n=1 Tax=Acinetobacter sp. TaxID=472 RepID=UPI000DB4123B|nr:hypothetical protein [Acinetobacter sp.]PZT87755.1 MAG: hypothetical protein DI627_05785 [Acinetobacter sp.]
MKKIVLAILAGLAICVFILGQTGPKNTNQPKEGEIEEIAKILKPDTDLIVQSKRHLRGIVKDPDSIKYKNLNAFLDKDGNSYACGEFNSKNSFGAYVGYRKFVYSGKTLIMDGESKIPFNELEKKFCTITEIKS